MSAPDTNDWTVMVEQGSKLNTMAYQTENWLEPIQLTDA